MSNSISLPLRCLVCDTQPDTVFSGADRWQPHAATIFDTSGHFGSTVFDDMTGGRRLALVVCDNCLRERADRLALVTSYAPPARHAFSPWNPEEEDDD